jgi:O-antigen/teichoic acid export membrane protein
MSMSVGRHDLKEHLMRIRTGVASSAPEEPFDGAPPGADMQVARSAFHLVLGQAATTALAVILTGAIGRSLGPADFGNWFILSAVASFAFVFVDWGYSPYLIREVARRPERAGELTGTVVVLRSLAALGVCGLSLLTTWLLGYGPRMRELAAINIAASMPMLIASSFNWTFRGRERMDLEAGINVVLKVLVLGATLWLLASGLRLIGVIVAQAVAGAVAFVFAWRVYVRTGLPRLTANVATARELLRNTAPLFTLGLMIAVQPYIDANILAKIVPATVVGWYGATSVFSGTLLAPALILGAAVYPRLSQAAENPAAFARMVRAALRPMLFLAMLGAVGAYSFADFAISTVYHQENFAPAATILRFFSLNLFLVSIDVLLGNMILATGSIKRLAQAKIVTVAVTTALELFLVRRCQTQFGNGGIGTMLSLGAGEIVMIVAALRLMPAGAIDRAAIADFGRALLAGAGAWLTLHLAGPISPFAGIPLAIAAHCVLSFALGLITPADVDCLRQVIGRTKSRPLAPLAASAA